MKIGLGKIDFVAWQREDGGEKSKMVEIGDKRPPIRRHPLLANRREVCEGTSSARGRRNHAPFLLFLLFRP